MTKRDRYGKGNEVILEEMQEYETGRQRTRHIDWQRKRKYRDEAIGAVMGVERPREEV